MPGRTELPSLGSSAASQSAPTHLQPHPTDEKISFIAKHIIVYDGSRWEFSRKFFATVKEQTELQKAFAQEIDAKGQELLGVLKTEKILEGHKTLRIAAAAEDTIRVTFPETPEEVRTIQHKDLAPYLIHFSNIRAHLQKALTVAKKEPPLFENYKNSCHFNSVMSAIARNDRIRGYLLQSKKRPLVRALQQYEKNPECVDFHPLHHAVAHSIRKKQMRVGRQEDVQETFLRVLYYAKLPKGSPLNAEFIEQTIYNDGSMTEPSPQYGFPEISLPLAPRPFQTLVQEALYTKKLPPSDPLADGRVPIQKLKTFEFAPEVLLVHLQRFGGIAGKIEDPVDIPLQFPLPKEGPFGEEAPYGDYRLESFIIHLGATPDAGHYVSYFRQESTYWYYDDREQEKRPISEEEFHLAARSAYTLVYNKI